MKKAVIGLTFLFISLQFLLPLSAQVADLYELKPDETSSYQINTALDENGQEIETKVYHGYTITKYNGNEENLIVPSHVNNLSITKIGERAFAGNKNIVSVEFKGSVPIESEAFADCPNLRTVKAQKLTYYVVAADAFNGCKNVKIYASIASSIAGCAFLNDFEIIDESEYFTEDGFAYQMYNGEPFLIKYMGYSEKITIPQEIGGKKLPDRTGQNLFAGNRYVKEIIVPENITYLSNQMFANCPNLTDVYINGHVNSMSSFIFANSPNVTLHILPDNSAYYAAAEANIPIDYLPDPDSFIDGDFVFKKDRYENYVIDIIAYIGKDENVVVPSKVKDMPVLYIIGNGFSGNSDIVSVTIPSSIKFLSYNIFYDCPNLTEVTIEGTETSVFKSPFGNKTNEDLVIHMKRGSSIEWRIKELGLKIEYLKLYPDAISSGDFEYIILNDGNISITGYTGENIDELIIPETIDDRLVVGMHDEAFKGYGIKKFVLPYSIMFIGDYAFSNSALEEIDLPYGLTSIGEWAFSSSALKKVVLPDTLGEIGHGTFMQCQSLKEIKFGEYLRYIGPEALSVCTNLTEINLPDGLEVIGEKAFRYCINVTDIYIPDTVTEIGGEVFSEMTKLKTIKLPSGLNFIPPYTFYGCWELKEIDVPEGVTMLGYRAFMHSKGLQHIILPSTLTEVNPAAFENENRYPFNDLKKLTIPEYIVDRYREMVVPHCPYVSDIIIQPGIKEVKRFTFSDLSKIRIVELPDTVTAISNSAFSNCADLEYVYIPKTVTKFGDNIFTDCSKLTIVVDDPEIIEEELKTAAEEYAEENEINFIYFEEYLEKKGKTQW